MQIPPFTETPRAPQASLLTLHSVGAASQFPVLPQIPVPYGPLPDPTLQALPTAYAGSHLPSLLQRPAPGGPAQGPNES